MAGIMYTKCGYGSRVGPKEPWAGSQEARGEAFSCLGCGFPICERGTEKGAGWPPRFTEGELPGGGEQGGTDLGTGME